MHDELWAGPELKLDYAWFHFQKMETSLAPRERTRLSTEYGVTMHAGPQHSMFAHFDAFLSAARSIPEIIQCCFGDDRYMRKWLETLPLDERSRRSAFRDEFTGYGKFRAIPLSQTRHTSEHRRGYASVEVKITARFGVVHIGGPAKPILAAKMPPIDNPPLPLKVQATPVEPRHGDFTIEGQPLFDVCRHYLEQAQQLINGGRVIADRIHGGKPLTLPPDA
jgi:hypothetical protein